MAWCVAAHFIIVRRREEEMIQRRRVLSQQQNTKTGSSRHQTSQEFVPPTASDMEAMARRVMPTGNEDVNVAISNVGRRCTWRECRCFALQVKNEADMVLRCSLCGHGALYHDGTITESVSTCSTMEGLNSSEGSALTSQRQKSKDELSNTDEPLDSGRNSPNDDASRAGADSKMRKKCQFPPVDTIVNTE